MIITDKEIIAWIAGLLEGEGCFYFTASSPVIQLSMTDRDIVVRAAKILGGSGLVRTESRRKLGHKDIYTFRVFGKSAVDWMLVIRPLMGVRRSKDIYDIIREYESKPRSTDVKCKRGHDLTNPKNYYFDLLSGKKSCKQCRIVRQREGRFKRKIELVS